MPRTLSQAKTLVNTRHIYPDPYQEQLQQAQILKVQNGI
ncbi:hypothetical protein AC24_4910 [Escherichia coli 8-415-05_S3_C2]|uniref:Uncharacterized protein n=1 Tax=Escherichia coli 2-460-02_S1_C1 TaxID=1444044 RepID=A0A837AIG5_ECOLX|nr:hypothetical protein AB21_4654 [Escherichia coli 4-203-08_S1_C1]KEJ82142.1 hypothetical protein AC37_5608 [Escherichia coli 6-175-07_S3_C2]KEK90723.1 hypothetical protein AB49_4697 [Escherichia coli 4-203-08_S1_C2]KEK91340.1 hypothetical protein AB78_4889 [Escherichia coli 4-203-08_S1_C3]KEL88186.1 hypothetical protein AC62_5598 [Escherichia coli 6-175-07_S3_C3]KEM38039.1 hypothetical protein AC38_5397 [Escherichia coli 6-319-05_S3_C2]KEM56043.1 hypothetical protein AC63_5194 [Escherichia 